MKTLYASERAQLQAMSPDKYPPNPVAKAVQLHIWLGQILRDPTRRDSEEFDICILAKNKLCAQMHEMGIDQASVYKAFEEIPDEALVSTAYSYPVSLRQTTEVPRLSLVPGNGQQSHPQIAA